MGKYSEEKRKTEIEQKMDRVLLIEKIDKTKLKIAKKLGKKQGITMHSGNIAAIAHKKLEHDIIPQFEAAGIDFWKNSIVTRAVIEQIIMYAKRGESFLDEINHILMPSQNERQLQIRNRNSFSRMFAKISRVFLGKTKNILPENIEQIHEKLRLYDEANESLDCYSLRENIVAAIVNQLCPEEGIAQLGCFVPRIVNDEVAPILNKLGLGDLIPELHARLKERYETLEAENVSVPDECKLPHFENMVSASENEGIEPGEE